MTGCRRPRAGTSKRAAPVANTLQLEAWPLQSLKLHSAASVLQAGLSSKGNPPVCQLYLFDLALCQEPFGLFHTANIVLAAGLPNLQKVVLIEDS